MYRIGLFSKLNKVTVKALRFYDEIGLLKPAHVDPETGYRYYATQQMPVLHQIIFLRQIGFSIDEIHSVLHGGDLVYHLECRRKEIEATIEEGQRQLTQINHYLTKGDLSMGYQVVLKELPEVLVYSKRMVIPDYQSYFQLIPAIGKEVMEANPGLECAVPEYCFVIYHDGEYKEKEIDVEFCEAVTSVGREISGISFKTIKRVPTAACVYHKGPYETIGKAYAHLFNWIADNGYTPADKPRESYIDGIWNQDSSKDWLTEVQIPVVPRN